MDQENVWETNAEEEKGSYPVTDKPWINLEKT